MRNPRRFAKATAAIAALSLALVACAPSGGDAGTGGGEAAELDSVTWMSILHTPTTPTSGGPIEQGIAELTGTEVKFQWVPAASADEKINAVLASDTLADINTLTNIGNASVRNALASGQFWDVEPYLSEFENLAAIDEETIASARVEGKLYGVPFTKPKARYGVLIRQDWLDNLGLEVPHTLEDLAEVAVAFANDDPDGNGVDDTTGFIDRLESFRLGFRMLAGYFGAGNRFEVTEDDEVVPTFQTETFKEAMAWYRDLYQQGAVNNEFVTVQKQNQQDAIAQNKGGIVVTGLFEARNYMNIALNADPNTPMAWALVNDMTYGDVPRRILSDTNGGFGGWMAIPTTRVKTEGELRAILGFIDRLLEEDAFMLMTNGVEGTHYEIDAEGSVSIIDGTKWEQEVQPYNASRPSDARVYSKDSTPYVNLGNELIEENAEFAVVDPSLPLSSPTYDQRWSVLEQGAIDAYNKYMVGQLDMAGYEAAIEDLRGQGLDKIIEEFTAAYAETN